MLSVEEIFEYSIIPTNKWYRRKHYTQMCNVYSNIFGLNYENLVLYSNFKYSSSIDKLITDIKLYYDNNSFKLTVTRKDEYKIVLTVNAHFDNCKLLNILADHNWRIDTDIDNNITCIPQYDLELELKFLTKPLYILVNDEPILYGIYPNKEHGYIINHKYQQVCLSKSYDQLITLQDKLTNTHNKKTRIEQIYLDTSCIFDTRIFKYKDMHDLMYTMSWFKCKIK